MKTLILVLMLACLLTAATKRDWKTGKITDSKTVETGIAAVGRTQVMPNFGGPAPPPPSTSTARAVTMTTQELVIVGGEYQYTVRDLGGGGLFRKPCRYIVGDDLKYVQEKSDFYLIDADGKECRAQIMKQERIPPPTKP